MTYQRQARAVVAVENGDGGDGDRARLRMAPMPSAYGLYVKLRRVIAAQGLSEIDANSSLSDTLLGDLFRLGAFLSCLFECSPALVSEISGSKG
jgi:hypothetical protein